MDLKNKKVTILGLARSGMASAEMTLRLGGIPKISDICLKEEKENLLKEWKFKDKVEIEFEGHTQSFIEDSDLVVISPGIRIDSDPVKWARSKNIDVFGEVEFAHRFCQSPVIAITGSNGKTTVSTLIKEVLEFVGKDVCLCGNIGSPFSKYVLDLKKDGIVVMEISSFQLESIISFRPYVSVFLNFSQNHLDRHKDTEEYFDAKKRIFLNQTKEDYAVLDYENTLIRDLEPQISAKVCYYNKPGSIASDIKNQNYLTVMAVAKIFGIKEDLCKEVFKRFKGVEHRLELVRSINDVDFINDSKSTTAESARWALNNISKPILMICGGKDKNIDFAPLRDLVKKKVKKMFIIGEAQEKIRNTFKDSVDTKDCDSLKSAVLKAKESANKGDCVILSPMCASFDMFKDYEDRGRIFKDIVNKLY